MDECESFYDDLLSPFSDVDFLKSPNSPTRDCVHSSYDGKWCSCPSDQQFLSQQVDEIVSPTTDPTWIVDIHSSDETQQVAVTGDASEEAKNLYAGEQVTLETPDQLVPKIAGFVPATKEEDFDSSLDSEVKQADVFPSLESGAEEKRASSLNCEFLDLSEYCFEDFEDFEEFDDDSQELADEREDLERALNKEYSIPKSLPFLTQEQKDSESCNGDYVISPHSSNWPLVDQIVNSSASRNVSFSNISNIVSQADLIPASQPYVISNFKTTASQPYSDSISNANATQPYAVSNFNAIASQPYAILNNFKVTASFPSLIANNLETVIPFITNLHETDSPIFPLNANFVTNSLTTSGLVHEITGWASDTWATNPICINVPHDGGNRSIIFDNLQSLLNFMNRVTSQSFGRSWFETLFSSQARCTQICPGTKKTGVSLKRAFNALSGDMGSPSICAQPPPNKIARSSIQSCVYKASECFGKKRKLMSGGSDVRKVFIEEISPSSDFLTPEKFDLNAGLLTESSDLNAVPVPEYPDLPAVPSAESSDLNALLIPESSELNTTRLPETFDPNTLFLSETSDLNTQFSLETSDLNALPVPETSDLNALPAPETSALNALHLPETSDLNAPETSLQRDIPFTHQNVSSVPKEKSFLEHELNATERKIKSSEPRVPIKLHAIMADRDISFEQGSNDSVVLSVHYKTALSIAFEKLGMQSDAKRVTKSATVETRPKELDALEQQFKCVETEDDSEPSEDQKVPVFKNLAAEIHDANEQTSAVAISNNDGFKAPSSAVEIRRGLRIGLSRKQKTKPLHRMVYKKY